MSVVKCLAVVGWDFFLCLLHTHTSIVDGTLCLSSRQRDGRNACC